MLMKIVERGISTELDIRNGTERAFLRTSILGGKGNDPLFLQRHTIAIRNAINGLCEAEKIGFDVMALTIITDAKGF